MDRFLPGKVAPSSRAMDGETRAVATDVQAVAWRTHSHRTRTGSLAFGCAVNWRYSLRFLRWALEWFLAPARPQSHRPPRNRDTGPFRIPATSGLPFNHLSKRLQSVEPFFAHLARPGTPRTFEFANSGVPSAPRQARPPQSFREFRMQPDFRSSSPPAGRTTGRRIQGSVPHSAALPAIDGSAVLPHYQP